MTLKNMTLRAADPTSFNDPFEVRPGFDQARHDHFAGHHERFHASLPISGNRFSLLGNRSMVGQPTEHAVDFGDEVNALFRNELRRRFRVISFSENPHSVLMWGHYAECHAGLLLGIDTNDAGFFSGLKRDGFIVSYDDVRQTLPLSYYQGISLEEYDLQGNITNNPNQEVLSDAGLVIPFSEYRRQVDEATLKLLTTKAKDWKYEAEVRYIYDLKHNHAKMLRDEKGFWYVKPGPSAIKEVILGARASMPLVTAVVEAYRAGSLGEANLYFAWFHPYLHKVEMCPASPQYLLDFYPYRRV